MSKAARCTYPRCACKATGAFCSSKPEKKAPKKSIARRSVKGELKAEHKKTLVQNDMVFYLNIWDERIHVDFETGKPLPQKPLMQFFHHVLEKRNFPQYRHCRWNIVLLSWQTHENVERFLEGCPKVLAYTKKLQSLHDQGLLANMDPNLDVID